MNSLSFSITLWSDAPDLVTPPVAQCASAQRRTVRSWKAPPGADAALMQRSVAETDRSERARNEALTKPHSNGAQGVIPTVLREALETIEGDAVSLSDYCGTHR